MDADKQHLARGTAINIVGLVVRNISPVLVVLLARTFPQDVFGVFVSVQMFVLTASRVVVFGLDKGLTWYLPQNVRDERPPDHGLGPALARTHLTALIVVLAVAGFIAAGGLDWFRTLDAVSDTFVLICVTTLVPYMSLHCWAAAFEGIRRPEYNLFINQFFTTSIGPITALSLHALGVGDIALAIGYVSSHVIGAALLWLISRSFFPGLSFWKSAAVPPALMSYSIPIGLSHAVGNVALRVDLWMLLLLASAEDAAIYAMMMMLTNGIRGIRQGYDPLIIPIVGGMKPEQRRKKLPEAFSYAVNMVTSIQILVAVGILFFPKEILSIAGKDYAVKPEALAILLVGNLINGMLAMNGVVISGLGYSRAFLGFNILALLLNIAFNFAFIPTFGLVGAAMATALAYLLQCIGMVYYQQRLTGLQLYQPHLALNGGVIAAFAIVAFGFQDRLLSLGLLDKLPWFALVAAALATLFYVKRQTYSVKSDSSAYSP